MKKFLTAIFMCLVCCLVFLTGCGSKGFKDNPKTNDVVLDNGGYSVQKGDYIYFTNGFDEYTNASSSVTVGALYRAKVGDTNGYAQVDEDGYLQNAELITSRLVGYKYGGFYIFGDYIYYVTPITRVDNSGNSLKDHIELHRININGTDDNIIFESNNAVSDETTWKMTAVDGNVYFVMIDGDELVCVKANGKASTTTLAKGVSSFAIYTPQDYMANATLEDIQKYVYYSRASGEGDNFTGSALCRVALGQGKEYIVRTSVDQYKLIALTNKLYFTNSTNQVETIDGANKWAQVTPLDYSYDSIMVTEDYVVSLANTDLYCYDFNNDEVIVDTNVTTLLCVNYDNIYYIKDSELYHYNINQETSKMLLEDVTYSMDTESGMLVESTGTFITFLNKLTGSDGTERKFMARANVLNDNHIEYISVFADGMKPEEK